MTLRRTRDEGCASDLLLDRAVCGELDGVALTELETHLATCDDCRLRHEAVRQQQATFDPALPVAVATRARATPPSWRRWAAPAGAVLAMAAGVLLLLRSPGPETIESRERIKGGAPALTFAVRHEGVVRHGVEREQVAPGDGVQFAYSAREAGYLAVLSVDGARQVSVYYPEGEQAAPFAAGQDVTLERSTVLDDTLGEETVFAFFCQAPQPLGPLRAALVREPSATPVVAGCTVDRHVLVKARP